MKYLLNKKNLCLFFIIINLCGCTGYKFGLRREFPGGAQKVAVPTFENKTYEAGIENAFTQALKYELLKSGHVRIVKVEEAEAIIQGNVASFIVTPSGSTKKYNFQNNSQRGEKLLETGYIATVSLDIQVISQKNQEVLWSYSLSKSEAYSVNPDKLTDNENDQPHLSNEINQREAIRELAENMMEEVHEQLFMGF
ncbi:MAG: hypothetical protein HYW47_03920 [Deltaproteobacteria bacterium]|nr:hypothetical protein [Deltaproteobacteria bacterium]